VKALTLPKYSKPVDLNIKKTALLSLKYF